MELVRDLESLIDGLIAACIEKKPAVRYINRSMTDTLMSIKEIQLELSEQMVESEVVRHADNARPWDLQPSG